MIVVIILNIGILELIHKMLLSNHYKLYYVVQQKKES